MSYRRLGDMVKFISNKNTYGNATVLFGINIDKFFMPSVANIIGVDLKKYKVVEKYQFACNRMHVGRDERLPISMSTFDYDFIVSPAYDVFEVITSDVLPEYLMLWFRRKEFDRQCWFYTDADVRGGLHLDALKSIEINVPPIEEQRQIVAQYQSIANKIKVNEQICEKLEATAQALYKHWFVDFEFPNEAGKPYKSSEGKMVWNEELGKEIPEGWKMQSLGELLVEKGYIRGPFGSALKKDDMQLTGYPVYEQQHIIDDHRNFRYYIDDVKYKELKRFSVKSDDFIISCSGTIGRINVIKKNDIIGVINQALLILRFDREKIDLFAMFYFLTSKIGNSLLTETSSGSAQINIGKKETIYSIRILNPDLELRTKHNMEFELFYIKIETLKKQNQKLTQLQSLLLSRLAVGEEVSV